MDENTNKNNGFEVDTESPEVLSLPQPEPPKTTVAQEAFEWLDVVVTAVIAVVVLFSLVFRVATIDGYSMFPTLTPKDRVVITNFAYTPEYGDIVVISRNIDNAVDRVKTGQMPIIKRVIAVGGQTVEITEDGSVKVDGKVLEEGAYIPGGVMTYAKDVQFPLYVPEGYVFVMGDNREDSLDSRFSQIGEGGLIDTRYILGHAVFRIFPFQSIGGLKEP